MSCTLVFLCVVCRVEQWRVRIMELLTKMWYLHFLYINRLFCMTDMLCPRVSDSLQSVVSFVCFHACSGCTNRVAMLVSSTCLAYSPPKKKETCLAYSKSADCIRDKRRRSVQVAFLSILAFCTRLLAHWPSQQNLLWTSELPACVVCQCMNWRRCRFLLQETPKKVKRPDLNTVQNWRRARAVRNVKIYDKINAVHSSMIRSNGPCSNSRCSCTSEFSFSTPWMDDAGQLLLRTAH